MVWWRAVLPLGRRRVLMQQHARDLMRLAEPGRPLRRMVRRLVGALSGPSLPEIAWAQAGRV